MAIGGVAPLTPEVAPVGNEYRRTSNDAGAEFAAVATAAISKNAPTPPVARSRPVVPTRTSLSGEQAAEAIDKAFTELRGSSPSKATLAILTSHWSLETGQGARMYNYNFAGIKGTSPEGLTASLRTREGFGENTVHIRDGFRAYSTAEAGARDYVGLLVRRYAPALDAATAENAGEFVHQLKQGGYFTGHEGRYARGLTQLANRVMEHGANSVGGTRGALSTQPALDGGYFGRHSLAAGPARSGLAQRRSSLTDLSVALGGAPGATWSAGSMAEAVTRAALSIAISSNTNREDSDRRS